MRTLSTLVLGGGIGGLAVALGLARRGRDVHVIEKADAFGEIGAGLQLAPNASRALADLGVLDAIDAFAVFPQRMVWMDAISGEQVTSLDLGAPFIARYGYRYIVMHRSDLLDALLAACRAHDRITLETAKDVRHVDDRGDTAEVTFADGTTYAADIVIGADGLWSTARKAIVDDGEPLCSQYVAYRGAIPIDEISVHAGLDSVTLWTGPNLHLVQYPVRRGELYNQVAVFKSDRYRPDSDDWGHRRRTRRAFLRRRSAGARGAHEIPAQSALADVRSAADRVVVARTDRPARRCRAPDAAIPRAGCRPSARRCRGARRCADDPR